MPKAADGEFELVLENRQVMTAFFVVVILCGIFFGLGYIVGKNTMQPVQAKEEAAPASDAKESAMKAEKKEAPAPQDSAASDLSFSKDLASNTPAPKLEAGGPAAAPAPSQPAPTTPAQTAAAATRPAETPSSSASADQVFWQVAATKSKDDAESTASLLRTKGFSAHAEVKPDGLYHVLVTSSNADSENTKAKLVQAGFKPFKKS